MNPRADFPFTHADLARFSRLMAAPDGTTIQFGVFPPGEKCNLSCATGFYFIATEAEVRNIGLPRPQELRRTIYFAEGSPEDLAWGLRIMETDFARPLEYIPVWLSAPLSDQPYLYIEEERTI